MKNTQKNIKDKLRRAGIHHSAALHLGIVSVSLVYPFRTRIRTAVGTVVKTNPLAIPSFLQSSLALIFLSNNF